MQFQEGSSKGKWSTMSTDECSNIWATFYSYFVNKINNLKHSILNKLGSFTLKPHFVEQPHAGPQFETIPLVTPAEVRKLLTSIPSKSCKLDFIPTSLLKSCSNVFSELICTLANLSFAEGCFPAIFKQAIVKPLIKKPGLDKSEPSNFRPISNLNNISKLLERLFLTRFQPHISNSPNFNPLQSAYRKFHSTETSLLNTLDQVYTAADSSQPTVLVSLDLSAAFDTIDHHILLSRLQAIFGVSGSAIGWISSYLTDRVQRVVVGHSQSENTSLSTGVLQGSVLGPLLFSIFTSPVGLYKLFWCTTSGICWWHSTVHIVVSCQSVRVHQMSWVLLAEVAWMVLFEWFGTKPRQIRSYLAKHSPAQSYTVHYSLTRPSMLLVLMYPSQPRLKHLA